MVDSLVYENAKVAPDQTAYQEKYDRYANECRNLEERLEALTTDLHQKKSQSKSIQEFIHHLPDKDLVTDFDERLWYTMVDTVVITSKEEVNFHFKNGAVISM